MQIDYAALSEENLKRYGTDVGEWAPELLANLYHERTHFVFELLQNAEDAIRKRASTGSRSVRFELSREGLRVSHKGKPFDEADVRGICGINKSTKKDELTAIGRFGIGFKSVYAVTDRPEIRSAGQHFAIEDYVHPVELQPCEQQDGETSFWFPFRPEDSPAFGEISEGLEKLDAKTLLFLRHVEEVDWSIEDGASGTYCRESVELKPGLRRVTLIGTSNTGGELAEEQWLVFSRPVESDGVEVGAVEIAYSVDLASPPGELKLKPVADSRLAAFFPTSVQTNLGVVLQAPYRTTPARDNVPPKATWNQHLIEETASLLVESLGVLRDMDALSVDVLSGMPIDEDDFPEGSMFRPLYDAFAEALEQIPLLPTSGGSFARVGEVKLTRRELIELVSPEQLQALFESDTELEWLDPNLTLERMSAVSDYLRNEHGITELTPQGFVTRVTPQFLTAQPDSWIEHLYEYLGGLPYLWKVAANLNKPWARLEDGSHVAARSGERHNAYLPSASTSGFPTVRSTVCASEDAFAFLQNSLKLTKPDPVDGVIVNILPLYGDGMEHDDLELYREHLQAIQSAFENRNTRERLTNELRTAYWIPSVDDTGVRKWVVPTQCYLPTERLKTLFEGVSGVRFIDESVTGLQGEDMREVLLASGVSRTLKTVTTDAKPDESERAELRQMAGYATSTGGESHDNRTIGRLNALLKRIAELPFEQAVVRCQILWDALGDLVEYRREAVLRATYHWFYGTGRSTKYDAEFVRILKASEWIPTPEGKLSSPDEVVFEHIEPPWEPNAVLQSALKFRPSALAQLAEATGLNLDVLSRIKKSGLSDEEVLQRLGLVIGVEEDENEEGDNNNQGDEGGDAGDSGASAGSGSNQGEGTGAGGGGGSSNVGGSRSIGSGSSSGAGGSSSSTSKNSHAGRREFFSYLKTHPVEVEDDEFSDSETHEQRMKVEAVAIDHILTLESDLQRTPAGNKGYDLFGTDDDGHTNRWIEVKAMVGTLANHPVGMSKAQFEMALEKGYRYWLYIVENATSEEPRILKIQDPAGNARTFTFDEGWREIAMVSQVNVETGEVKA
ncbi:MAG: DUF3883 domain-containing protein [Fimbriimonadaceae bacterium]|nr:DUF3883 domain-containing protein [Fimbriimonadaceae bacterium]QYK55967.1 MAG: DUF3883 domain-containing protein [Fimbriimonadaceae bacterium]